MVIRGTPTNRNDYVLVDNITSNYLHMNGFTPRYMDKQGIYYEKSDKILKCIQNMTKEG